MNATQEGDGAMTMLPLDKTAALERMIPGWRIVLTDPAAAGTHWASTRLEKRSDDALRMAKAALVEAHPETRERIEEMAVTIEPVHRD